MCSERKRRGRLKPHIAYKRIGGLHIKGYKKATTNRRKILKPRGIAGKEKVIQRSVKDF